MAMTSLLLAQERSPVVPDSAELLWTVMTFAVPILIILTLLLVVRRSSRERRDARRESVDGQETDTRGGGR